MLRRNLIAAHWVLWICLLMSLSVVLILRWSLRREAHLAFDTVVQQIQSQIDFRVERYQDVLLQARAHFQTEKEITKGEFSSYIHSLSLSERFPGMQGIGYVKRVSAAQVPQYSRKIREEGVPSFRVWPENPAREDYFPIVYIEPSDWRNQRAIGYDMFTEEVRHAAMARARDEGRAVMSRRVVLVQETERDRQFGFLMYVPIYRHSTVPASPQERRDSLTGFVYSPFRARQLFERTLRGYDLRLLDIHIYASDRADPEQLIYDHNPETNSPEGLPSAEGLFRETVSLQVPGGTWTIAVGSSHEFVPFLTRLIPYGAGFAGLMITFLLYWMVRNQEVYSRSEAEARKTLELVNEVGRTISAELDLDRLVQSVIRIATQLTRARFGAFVYSVENEAGENVTLYALSGMEREQLEHFPLTRSAGLLIRSADIAQDLRFGGSFAPKDQKPGFVRSFLSVPVTSRSGEPLGALLFGHPACDVFSEREELIATGLAAQAAVAIDNARLYRSSQEAIRARDEFLSICSHELKTPLTSLKLQTQMYRRKLRSGDPTALAPDRMEKLTQTSERQIDRLSQLVEDMLDIARISSGRLTIRPERVELYSLVAEMIERVTPSAGEALVPIRLHGPSSSIVGNWDRLRIEQVVLNLLSNSIKYGEQKPVDVTLELQGEQAIIIVQDQGIGIDQANQKRIFERFERAISATNISGLGLGLYIVRQILEAHEGSVEVESEIGHGARFVVHLPLNPSYAKSPPPVSLVTPPPKESGSQVLGSSRT